MQQQEKKKKQVILVGQDGEVEAYAIDPKTDCPHFSHDCSDEFLNKLNSLQEQFLQIPCKECQNIGENWICLTCFEVFCSRYVKGHMAEHNQQNNQHNIAFSFMDASYWCYDCDSYITNQTMNQMRKKFSDVKFKDQQESDLEKDLANLNIDDKNKQEEQKQSENTEFTRQVLIQGLKQTKFKKVIFFTGAGISVSAGIPDFRSPNTGVYSQLKKFNLPRPESIFELNYFKQNPQPFYIFSKSAFESEPKPTINHYFQKEFQNQGILTQIYSQNIDGLEVDAGVNLDVVNQAHGHYRSAHCSLCLVEKSIDEFKECVKTDKIQICNTDGCQGFVKPDIIFFGEQLPPRFFEKVPLIQSADLVFIMGTSLQVQPFASLVSMVQKTTPIVLINRENPGLPRKEGENFLFLSGDLDNNVTQLMKDCGWNVPQCEKKEIQTVDMFKDIQKL